MYFKELPKRGDSVKMYVTFGPQCVINVRPYDGKYPQFFTHIMKHSSPITMSGTSEIAIDVGEARRGLK